MPTAKLLEKMLELSVFILGFRTDVLSDDIINFENVFTVSDLK